MSIFGGAVFFWKKMSIYAKELFCWQMSEFSSTMIKSCCANFWGKVTSVSLNINFLAKLSILFNKKKKKKKNSGEMLTFPLSVHYYWKWSSFCKTCLFFEKCDSFCEGLYTLTNCLILVKIFNFLGYIKLYMLIFIKVFHLLENCYF